MKSPVHAANRTAFSAACVETRKGTRMKLRRDKGTEVKDSVDPPVEQKTAPKRRKVRAHAVNIDITQEAIDDATRGNSGHCMIADSIKKQMPEMTSVFVDLQTIRWTDRKKGVRYVYLTPRDGQEALVNWDQGVDPQPFRLRLTPHMAQVVRMKKVRKGAGPQREPRGKRTLVREHNGVTQIEGGLTPPAAALPGGFGARREFGVRGLRQRES